MLQRRHYLPLAFIAGIIALRFTSPDTWGENKKNKTVSTVTAQLEEHMQTRFPALADLIDGQPIALLAFKKQPRLELWKSQKNGWVKIKTYPFTGYSGTLGPKLREGDRQIPEGLYKIEYLNPNSSYHLSLKIDYPNAFDRKMGKADQRTKLGYDIFLHGKNATVGCIPVGDPAIEEIFYLIAKNGYQNTQIIIAPWDFRANAKFPSIPSIPWEELLYSKIKTSLKTFTH